MKAQLNRLKTKQEIKTFIAIWKEAQTRYQNDYNTAVKYDDFGARETAEEMIKYSQRKIDVLEDELMKIKKGA